MIFQNFSDFLTPMLFLGPHCKEMGNLWAKTSCVCQPFDFQNLFYDTNRPYICEECGEGFVRNDKLTVHRRRAHTGERPYPCDLCEWRGVDSSSLIHHKKKHVKQLASNITVDEELLKINV